MFDFPMGEYLTRLINSEEEKARHDKVMREICLPKAQFEFSDTDSCGQVVEKATENNCDAVHK